MPLKLGTLFYDIGADTSGLSKAEGEVDKTTKQMGQSFGRLGTIIKAAIGIEAVRRVIGIADGMTVIEARVRRLTRSQKEFNNTMRELFDISNRTGAAITDTIQQFQRFKLAGENIKATNEQALQFTETFQKIGILAGNTTAEVANTGIQLGQALASGTLRGDELRSVLEQMPEIAKLIEKEMGILPGTLKKASQEGKVTSDVVFKAILGQSERINEEFGKFPLTVERANTALVNGISEALSEANKLTGTTEGLATVIDAVASVIAIELTEGIRFLNESIDLTADGLGDVEIAAGFVKKVVGEVWQIVKNFAAVIINLPANLKGVATIIFSEVDQAITTITSNMEVMKQTMLGVFDNDEEEAARAKVIAGIRDRARAEIETSERVTSEILTDIQTEQEAVRSASAERIRLRRQERAEGGRSKSGDTGNIIAPGVETNEAAVAKMLAQLGSETDQIVQAFVERQAKILEITAEGDDRRRELQLANAKRLNDDLALMASVANAQALGALDSALGSMNAVFAAAGKEGTAIAKAAFLAQKAIQVVQIIAATQVAAAQAAAVAAVGGPQAFFATEAAILAVGYSNAALVGGLGIAQAAGRQHGGNVSPAMAHQVNELGAPEILEQAGKQFLLPNGKGGTITPMGKTSGGGDINVTMISNGTPQNIDRTELTPDGVQIMISDAVKQSEGRTNASLASGRGPTARALNTGYDVGRRL